MYRIMKPSDISDDNTAAQLELKKFTPEQVEYVRNYIDDLLSERMRYEDGDISESLLDISISTIKTDYLIGATEDDLMTEADFDRIVELLAIIDEDAAYAVEG